MKDYLIHKESENLQQCPMCNYHSLVRNSQEPFFDIASPKSILVTFWKCERCKYEMMDSYPYD